MPAEQNHRGGQEGEVRNRRSRPVRDREAASSTIRIPDRTPRSPASQCRNEDTTEGGSLRWEYSSGLDNSASIRFLSALFADAIDLESVARSDVVMLAPDLLLDLSHLLREKLYRSAAFGADHVVMAAAVVLVLVARDAIVKGHLARQARIRPATSASGRRW